MGFTKLRSQALQRAVNGFEAFHKDKAVCVSTEHLTAFRRTKLSESDTAVIRTRGYEARRKRDAHARDAHVRRQANASRI